MASTDDQFSVAIDFHRAGRSAEAEQVYRRILEAEPRHHGALHMLGVACGQAGRREMGIHYIRQAIAICPTEPAYHNSLGEALRATGRIDEARACFEQALKLNPSISAAYFNLGLLLGIENPTEAQRHYEQAVGLEPAYAPMRVSLGNVLRAQGKLEEAVAIYRTALAVQPNDTDALTNLGEVLTELGRRDEANEVLRQALDLFYRDISHRYRSIFIHIPKNAGTSIRKALGLRGGGHRPWRYFSLVQPQIWRQYTSFAVVRNPWDRAVSAYHHAKMPESYWHNRQGRSHADYQVLADKSFEECLSILCHQPGRLNHEAWRDQSQWIVDAESPDKTLMVQTVLRYETLTDDFGKLCRRLRIDCEALPDLNRSERSQDYRSYYNERTRRMVEQLYAADIRMFGYSF